MITKEEMLFADLTPATLSFLFFFISKGCPSYHPYSKLVHLIQSFFNRNSLLRLNYVFKTVHADFFATMAHSEPLRLTGIHSLPPMCVCYILN